MSEIKMKTIVDQNSRRQEQNQVVPEVDITNEESLNKWANVLHVSPEELIKAVGLYGPKIRDLRLGFAKQINDEAA